MKPGHEKSSMPESPVAFSRSISFPEIAKGGGSFDGFAEQVRDCLGAGGCGVYLTAPYAAELVLRGAAGAGALAERLSLEEALWAKLLRAGEPATIALADKSAPAGAARAGGMAEGWLVAVPLPAGPDLCGMILVAFPPNFPPPDVSENATRLILLFFASTLWNIVSRRRARRDARQIEILSTVTHSLVGVGNPEEVVDAVIDAFRSHLAARAVRVEIFTDFCNGPGIPTLTTSPGLLAGALPAPSDEPYRAAALSSGSPLVIRADEGHIPEGIDGPVDAVLFLPLLLGDRPAGIVTAWTSPGEDGLFPISPENSPEDQHFLISLAGQISLSIINISTVCRTEALRKESRSRLREMEILQETNSALRGTMKLDMILRIILTGATIGRGLGFNRASLFLVNERTNILQGMLGIGPDSEEEAYRIWGEIGGTDGRSLSDAITEAAVKHPANSRFDAAVKTLRMPLTQEGGVLSRTILSGRPCNVTGEETDLLPEPGILQHLGLRAFAAAPMVASGRTLGAIVVDNCYNRRPITASDLRFLSLFANQAGLAIANAKVYRALERSNEAQKRLQDQLVQSERLATLGEVSANLAHEIRNPLVSIGGFARRLASRLPPGDTQRKYATIIAAEVRRLEQFLEDVLLFAREREPSYRPVSLNALLVETLALYEHDFAESGVEVSLDLEELLPPLQADPHQIRQIFINLFSNAAEAMAEGGELGVATSLETGPPPMIRAVVADTGGGVEPGVLSSLFTPFYTTKAGGHGLGLALTHRFVTAHQGRITVENRPGSGLAFTVLLPLSPAGGGPAARVPGGEAQEEVRS